MVIFMFLFTQLKVKNDFLKVSVVLGFGGILCCCKLRSLFDVIDVCFDAILEVEQWDLQSGVHIYKEDLSVRSISNNDEREFVFIEAVDKLHV